MPPSLEVPDLHHVASAELSLLFPVGGKQHGQSLLVQLKSLLAVGVGEQRKIATIFK